MSVVASAEPGSESSGRCRDCGCVDGDFVLSVVAGGDFAALGADATAADDCALRDAIDV